MDLNEHVHLTDDKNTADKIGQMTGDVNSNAQRYHQVSPSQHAPGPNIPSRNPSTSASRVNQNIIF